jgi:hypothetical protein
VASVSAPFYHWCFTISPAGVGLTSTVPVIQNVNRFITHHRMTIASTAIPLAKIDILHTNTSADTLTFKAFNAGVADSMVWITSAVVVQSFPVYADSVAFKYGQGSAAGDWTVTTYYER